jgi:hypothetical protein
MIDASLFKKEKNFSESGVCAFSGEIPAFWLSSASRMTAAQELGSD